MADGAKDIGVPPAPADDAVVDQGLDAKAVEERRIEMAPPAAHEEDPEPEQSKQELIAENQALRAQVAALTRRVAELEDHMPPAVRMQKGIKHRPLPKPEKEAVPLVLSHLNSFRR